MNNSNIFSYALPQVVSSAASPPANVEEPNATRYTGKLGTFDPKEHAVYTLLLEDHLGKSLRLEQERIGFNAVEQFICALMA